jgi:hypothetical protein
MTRRFTLRHNTDGRCFWSNVVVYDTATELRAAAQRHRPEEKDWDNAGGCFQPSSGYGRYLGIMRLCRDHLTPEVVIHESVHCAVAYTWKSLGLQAIHLLPFSPTSMTNREEVLAYAVHGIATALLNELDLV